MNEQVYLVHPDGTGLKRLTDGAKETNRLGVWSRDGRLLTLGSNRRSGAAIDAYVWDAETGTSRRQLWASDGTAVENGPVTDIASGAGSSTSTGSRHVRGGTSGDAPASTRAPIGPGRSPHALTRRPARPPAAA